MRWKAGLILMAICTASAARAHAADTSVVVLGLRSLEGDDDFANSLTNALRDAARGTQGWHLLDRAVSMAQMALAYNCDDIDTTCLGEIAKGLESDRVIFGTVRRTAAKNKYDYEVTASLFNAATHSIAGTETQVIERSEAKHKSALAKHAQAIVAKLSAADVNAARLTVDVNVLAADVSLDGQEVGQTHDGKLVLESVAPGEHTLDVSATGHQPYSQQVTVTPGDQNSVNIILERIPEAPEVQPPPESMAQVPPAQAAESAGSLNWLGYTLLGVGAASAIAWGASMYVIEFNYNQDPKYQTYVNSYGNRTQDACSTALGGNPGSLNASQFADFKSECRTGRTFQVLQWVFLGAAVVASGAGVYVLVSQAGKQDKAQARKRLREPRFVLTPVVDRHEASLSATLRF